MNAQHIPCIIFAVNQKSLEEDLALINQKIEKEPLTLIGSWEGKVEWSFLVTVDYLAEVQQLARETKQESILYLDNERQAYLLEKEDDYQLNKAVHIGRFIEASKEVALKEKGYTYNTTTNKYYIVA